MEIPAALLAHCASVWSPHTACRATSVLFFVQPLQDLWRQQQGCTAALASHPISVPAEVSPLQPAPRAEGKHGKKGKQRSEADDLLAEVRVWGLDHPLRDLES